LAAVWKREFPELALQPFHDGPLDGFASVGFEAHLFVILFESPASLFIGRPDRNSAN
jgi:hypothetical protein